jgi:hypothetical protein
MSVRIGMDAGLATCDDRLDRVAKTMGLGNP